MRLTEKIIRGIEPPNEDYALTWDADLAGLGLRTTAGGVKAFIYNYRTEDGRQRRATIGRWPALTATAARAHATKLRAKVETGGDPLGTKQARRGELTFADLVDEYSKRHLDKKRSGRETERYLRRYSSPAFGRLKASDVRRRDVIALVEDRAATAPVAANRLLSAISGAYNWGIRRDLLESNPCTLVQKAPEGSRDRVLSETEIPSFWARLDDAPRISLDMRDAMRLILLTLARPGEVTGMRWSEIDGDWWEIPGSRTKNGRSHRVPLNRMARKLLENRDRGSVLVFTSEQAAHLKRLSLSHALRHSRNHFGIPAFTPHDLRRTAASHVSALGTPRFVVERLLNHTDRSVSSIYDRYEHSKEKRQALEKWDRRLLKILSGETAKVVELTR